MTQVPLISVVIPTYNRASTILKSVESVLNQTYKNLELIIVDDCSTDDTQAIINNLKDNRVVFYKLPQNSGACTARNKGIEIATGQFIAFNDSDDFWHEDKLEKQLDCLINNNADIVTCKMSVFDENNNFMYDFPNLNEGAVQTKNSLLKYNCTSTQLLFGKSECFKTIQFDANMPRYQDWDECIRLSEKFTLFFQNEILVDTYQQKDSITKNPQKGIKALELLYQKHEKEIDSNSDIRASFYLKKAGIVRQLGESAYNEYLTVFKAKPNALNFIKLILAKLNLSVTAGNIKRRFCFS